MSGKTEHHADDARGSVLKKAVSFRNDIKSRITRKSSSAFTADNTVTKPLKKKTSFNRSGSFNDGHKVNAGMKKSNDMVGKLEIETKKVFQALRYIQDVVDKGILDQLHGTVSIVLDQITEFKSLIQKCFPNQDSSQLISAFAGLHQSLAKLMGLSDHLLLGGEEIFINKQEATELISSVKNSINELVKLAEENAKNFQSSPSEVMNDVAIVIDPNFESDSSQTQEDNEDLTRLTYSKNTKSKSAENIIDACQSLELSPDDVDGSHCPDTPTNDVPPPKPPMPLLSWHVGKFNSMPRMLIMRNNTDNLPPPLPEKKRNSAGMYDSDTQSSRSLASFMTNLAVPFNHSPTNSISSTFSASSEELLDDTPPKSYRTPSVSFLRRGSRGSQYDNVSDTAIECSSYLDDAASSCSTMTSCDDLSAPPPLPAKKSMPSAAGRFQSLGSQYDNVVDHALSSVSTTYETDSNTEQLSPSSGNKFVNFMPIQMQKQDLHPCLDSTSAVSRRFVSKVSEVHKKTISSTVLHNSFMRSSQVSYSEVVKSDSSQLPPPIPPKKHVQTYLSAFGECSSSTYDNFMRRSMHESMFYQMSLHQSDLNLGILNPDVAYRDRVTSLRSCSPSFDSVAGVTSSLSKSSIDSGLNPPIPPKQRDQSSSQITLDSGYGSVINYNAVINQTIPENVTRNDQCSSVVLDQKPPVVFEASSVVPDVSNNNVVTDTDVSQGAKKLTRSNSLEEEEVTDRLTYKQPNEDGPDIRGGSVDALIVHATTPGQTDYMYQEAFLMTYRTFISPSDLIKKLLQRYSLFSKTDDVKKKKLSRNAFSFLVRVVDELCRETNEQMLQILMDLVHQLLSDGEFQMARTMRKLVLEKFKNYQSKQAASHSTTLLSSFQLTAKTHSIVDFKAVNIAEQMTLLDAELFNKIEIPEVLRWSREQSEEHSPNLTHFTEHFNKMSYWCRTRILEQEEPKERERHLMKFIKIMKHLRRLNNFNSYLAILSAVDSAPVRRLEWQKQNVEALKEFCQLIDSTSSFRAYRQALAETSPPCIPYIGLVLQDLTFVNIGNLDCLRDGNINFSKCWQYYTIIENMSRFKKCNYDVKKSEKIIAFFNNFDNYLSEDSLWQISEMIKPRGVKAPAKQSD